MCIRDRATDDEVLLTNCNDVYNLTPDNSLYGVSSDIFNENFDFMLSLIHI